LHRLAAYALPALPLAVVLFPSLAILPGFYARHTAIPLATIGMILIVARGFDAVVDPFIGFISDSTRSRWGARKPWMVAGSLIMALSVSQLYAPSSDVGPLYYLGWFVAFYLGYSMIEIPYKAWGTEMARDYIDRTRIATAVAILFGIGNLAFAIAPSCFTARGDAHQHIHQVRGARRWQCAGQRDHPSRPDYRRHHCPRAG
jgi:Na+/melibiose symporter-like transporter